MRRCSGLVRGARLVLVVCVLGAVLLPPVRADAATPPPGYTDRTVVSGLNQPTSMAVAPDGRVFIAEKGGTVRVVKNDVVLPTPFVSLTVDSSGERGIIGIALDPHFPAAPYVYVHYTVPGSHNRVSRFTAKGDQAAVGSELPILDLPPLHSATSDNGGALAFGSDERLFVGVGDNGDGALAQQLDNPFGKVLDINADGSVPSYNPFVGVANADPRIWALGFHNPASVAADPVSGDVYVNDAGAGRAGVEEVDQLYLGANYGWPVVVGSSTADQFVGALYAYDHNDGSCAVSGGVFLDARTWTGGNISNYYYVSQRYLISDRCGGYVSDLVANHLVSSVSSPVALARSPAGGLYYLEQSGTLDEVRVNETVYLRDSLDGGPPTTTITQDHPARGETLACDWNGDGTDSLAVFVGGFWYITTNGAGPVDQVIHYGDIGDQAVCGDWNGDGVDTIGVWQNQHFYLRNSNTPGPPDIDALYGSLNGDTALAGDWNGDGIDTIGVYQFGHFFLRNSSTPGPPDIDAQYGVLGNDAVVGDWNGDGIDTIGVYLFNHFYLRNANTPGPPDVDTYYGGPLNHAVTGHFSAGPDRIGVTQPNA